MRSSKIGMSSLSVVLLTAGALSGCGGEAEDATDQAQGIVMEEQIQSVEAIIEPEPIADIEEFEPFGDLDLEEEINTMEESMEGILGDLSDASDDMMDGVTDSVTETTDLMIDTRDELIDATEENIAQVDEAMTELHEDAMGMVETVTEETTEIVEPVVDAFEDADEVVEVTSGLIRNVQQALADAGYRPGPVDGISGPRTVDAIKNFQQDNNLAVGELTKETLRALNVSY